MNPKDLAEILNELKDNAVDILLLIKNTKDACEFNQYYEQNTALENIIEKQDIFLQKFEKLEMELCYKNFLK